MPLTATFKVPFVCERTNLTILWIQDGKASGQNIMYNVQRSKGTGQKKKSTRL